LIVATLATWNQTPQEKPAVTELDKSARVATY